MVLQNANQNEFHVLNIWLFGFGNFFKGVCTNPVYRLLLANNTKMMRSSSEMNFFL